MKATNTSEYVFILNYLFILKIINPEAKIIIKKGLYFIRLYFGGYNWNIFYSDIPSYCPGYKIKFQRPYIFYTKSRGQTRADF